MKNLAGHPQATELFEAELNAAGVGVRFCEPSGETKCRVEGTATLAGGFVLTVHRAWVYQVVSMVPALPADLARKVNAMPCDLGGTKYSGETGTLGAVCRAEGMAGGLPDERIDDTDHWHIDVDGALAAFVRAVETVLAESPTDAATVKAAQDHRWVEGLLTELATMERSTLIHRIVLEALQRDPRSSSDPRVVALS